MYNRKRFRIVKKSPDSVMVAVNRGKEPIKMSWMDIKDNYYIEDNVWVIPNRECSGRWDELNKIISKNAVKLAKKVGKESFAASMSNVITEVKNLFDFNNTDIIKLIEQKYEIQNSKRTEKTDYGYSGSAVMENNPVLMKLKEQIKL